MSNEDAMKDELSELKPDVEGRERRSPSHSWSGQMTDLKNCPFCGGKAVVVPPARDFEGYDYTTSHVTCENCDTHGPDQLLAQGGDWQACVDAAIEAWNRRSPDTPVTVGEEALDPDALTKAYEARMAHGADPGRKGSGLEKAIRAYVNATRSRTGGREADYEHAFAEYEGVTAKELAETVARYGKALHKLELLCLDEGADLDTEEVYEIVSTAIRSLSSTTRGTAAAGQPDDR